MEANTQMKTADTEMSAPGSDGSVISPSGSAVSALQSKFKEISQRRSKGKEMHDVPLEGLSEPLQKKSDKEQSSLSIPEVKVLKSSNSADEVQNLITSSHLMENKWEKKDDSQYSQIPSTDSSLGEGSRMENFRTSGDGGALLSKPTSSPRFWTPPKGFGRLVRPETLVTNQEIDSLPITMNVVHASKEEQKLRVRGPVVHKELQGLASLESNFQRCIQKQQSPPDEPRREEIPDILSCQGGYKTEMAETEKVQITKTTLAMLAEGQYQPSLINKGLPPSYKEADWDTALIFGSEFNFRSDLTLSPRLEQAKRLLERARSKARAQNQNSDHGTQATQRQVLEMSPMNNSPPQNYTTTHEQKITLSVQLQDVQSRNIEHGAYLRQQDQLLSHVHFEDEPKKEAEHCYLDRVSKHGQVLIDNSLSNEQLKAQLLFSQRSKGLGSTQDSVGIPLAIPTNQAEHSLETVLCKGEPRKCKACGSILIVSHPKESTQIAEGQRNSGNQWVTSGQSSNQIIQPNLLEGTMLTGSSSLDENVEAAGASDAADRVSAFGKLRRRSRKGENKVETSYGPYARGQELLAQRRSSRTRANLEEVTVPHSKPARGVTFATASYIPTARRSRNYWDSAGIQLPIKSALKSGSKTRSSEQHGMKILPSSQEVERSPHHDVATPQDHGTTSQVSEVSSGLTPCIKPSSLRYSSPVVTPVEPVDECQAIVRGVTMSKTEDLRAELLRSEHRKAELQWDENVAVSRRTLEREAWPKLSLRRFFSAMGLNSMGKMVKGSRSSSMEQLSLPKARASSSPTHKGQNPLQRTPSLQTLHTESPLAQLRKASSVQSLQSPKKKYEQSTLLGELHLPLTPGPRDLQVKKGMENIDESQVSGPMGRIIQTFSDGSLLLELTRPVNAPFGFVISRAKGRGLYVEQVRNSATENIYTSLLGVGDEILEVNGEKVIGLSLEQVTCMMTCESTATLRILPHRWIQH